MEIEQTEYLRGGRSRDRPERSRAGGDADVDQDEHGIGNDEVRRLALVERLAKRRNGVRIELDAKTLGEPDSSILRE